jgi:predicted MPP superfamily phosphohydrolase
LRQDLLVLINDLVAAADSEADKVAAEDLVELLLQLALLLIVHNQVVVKDQVDLVRAVQDNDLALAVHLEKMLERKRVTNLRRRVAKRSTIWRRQH